MRLTQALAGELINKWSTNELSFLDTSRNPPGELYRHRQHDEGLTDPYIPALLTPIGQDPPTQLRLK